MSKSDIKIKIVYGSKTIEETLAKAIIEMIKTKQLKGGELQHGRA